MIKLLHFTDPHAGDEFDFSKFQYVRDIANAEKVDAVLCGGDFTEDFDAMPIMQIKHQRLRDLVDWISGEDGYLVGMYMQANEHGGIKNMKKSGNPELVRIAEVCETYRSKIESALEKYANRIKINELWTESDIKEARKDLDIDHSLRCFALDKIFGQIKCPVYAVRGNHDLDRFVDYKWKNLKFFNDVVDVKGLKIASAPNWYEKVSDVPADYEKMEQDMFFGGNTGKLSREFDDLVEDLSKKYSADEVRQIITTRIIPGIPVYQRLNGKQFDVLLTHKGPHTLAAQNIENKMHNFGSGIALENIIRQAKPKTILAGHVDEPLVVNQRVSDDYSYHGLRGSKEEFFVDYFDENTKRLAEFQRHRWSDSSKKAA